MGRMTPRLSFKLFDCGHQIGVALVLFGRRRALRFPNPFRIALSDADFHAGRSRWRWPVSLWAPA